MCTVFGVATLKIKKCHRRLTIADYYFLLLANQSGGLHNMQSVSRAVKTTTVVLIDRAVLDTVLF
jgi:hypothetical protein